LTFTGKEPAMAHGVASNVASALTTAG
jgi:hypothetical protein